MPPELLEDCTVRSTKPQSKLVNDTQDTNKYEGLTIQETTQEFLDAPEEIPAKDLPSVPTERYEPDALDLLEEEYLATGCLFQDILNTRSAVRWLWENHQEGMDIVAASLAVNTAIEFVRGLEEDFVRRFPKNKGYKDISKVFYAAQCLKQGQRPDKKEKHGNVINFAVYGLAEDTMLPTYSTLASL